MPNAVQEKSNRLIKKEYNSMILRRASSLEIDTETDLGKLRVIFMDPETDTMKIATPSYERLEQKYGSKFISNMDPARRSDYHTAFVNVTNHYLAQLCPETQDMFAVTYDSVTKEIVNMLQLKNFEANCVEYIYQNLDSKESSYMKQKEM